MEELSGFQRDILFTLCGMDAPSGREIKDAVAEVRDGRVQHARLYTSLDDLVEKGFVEKGSQDGRTNEYTLTAKGQRQPRARIAWEEAVLSTSDAAL